MKQESPQCLAILLPSLLNKDREQESIRRKKQKFQKTMALMPEIMNHLRSLLSQPGTDLVREIVVLANSRIVFTPSKKCFIFLGDRYKDLAGKISILEELKYIVSVSKDGADIYKMTEEFVGLILSGEPPSAGA